MWWARVSLVPQIQHQVAMGTAAWALWFVGYTWCLWWRYHCDRWLTRCFTLWCQFSDVLFTAVSSLSLFLLLIYTSLFIGLLIWVSKSILLFIWIMMTGIIYLYPSCSLSLFTKPSICLHSLSLWAMSPLPSSSSSVRRSVGCRRSRREPGERWKKRGSDYSSSRSDTHTQEVLFIYTRIQAHMQP